MVVCLVSLGRTGCSPAALAAVCARTTCGGSKTRSTTRMVWSLFMPIFEKGVPGFFRCLQDRIAGPSHDIGMLDNRQGHPRKEGRRPRRSRPAGLQEEIRHLHRDRRQRLGLPDGCGLRLVRHGAAVGGDRLHGLHLGEVTGHGGRTGSHHPRGRPDHRQDGPESLQLQVCGGPWGLLELPLSAYVSDRRREHGGV